MGGGATYTRAGIPIPIAKCTPPASAGAGMTHVARLTPRPTNIPTVHDRALLRFIRLSSLTCHALLTDTLYRARYMPVPFFRDGRSHDQGEKQCLTSRRRQSISLHPMDWRVKRHDVPQA